MRFQVQQWLASLFISGVIAFGLGVLIGGRLGWMQPVVVVTVVNHTDQPLTELQLKYRSTASSGTVELASLSVGERAVARFFLSGAGEYTVQAKLKDGTLLAQGEGYVESGYALTEVLMPRSGAAR